MKISVSILTLLFTAFFITGFSTVNASPLKNQNKNILMVVTNVDHFSNGHKTGVWLEEYATPYTMFVAKGYNVTVASPQGGATPIDPGSMKNGIPDKWSAAVKQLNNTQKLATINYKNYDAIIIPGGHGPLYDLSKDKTLANILSYFDASDRIIGTICHGAAALVTAKDKTGTPIVAGRNLTGFSNDEEIIAGTNTLVPFSVEDKLKKLGANYQKEKPWSSYVIIDKNLITGQNPQSSEEFANKIILQLEK